MNLSVIAQSMLSNPPQRFRLSHGLGLALSIDNTHSPIAILTLSRVGIDPGPREEEIIRREFKVPVQAERTTEVTGKHHIVRYRWMWSPPQLQMALNAS